MSGDKILQDVKLSARREEILGKKTGGFGETTFIG